MFSANPHPADVGSYSSQRPENRELCSSTGLSASIAHYRYQATYFYGQPDGKIEVVPRETKRFQAITSAGDN
jgi:hypothetical protein